MCRPEGRSGVLRGPMPSHHRHRRFHFAVADEILDDARNPGAWNLLFYSDARIFSPLLDLLTFSLSLFLVLALHTHISPTPSHLVVFFNVEFAHVVCCNQLRKNFEILLTKTRKIMVSVRHKSRNKCTCVLKCACLIV